MMGIQIPRVDIGPSFRRDHPRHRRSHSRRGSGRTRPMPATRRLRLQLIPPSSPARSAPSPPQVAAVVPPPVMVHPSDQAAPLDLSVRAANAPPLLPSPQADDAVSEGGRSSPANQDSSSPRPFDILRELERLANSVPPLD